MKIAIIGAGAMGSMHGGYLSKAGEEVWLVDPWEDHIEAINRNGLILCDKGVEEKIKLKATANPSDVGVADVVLFFVKSYDTADAVRSASSVVGPDTYAMTLQNGIGNVEAIMQELEMDRVVYGTTLLGGHVNAPGRIEVDVPPGERVMVTMGEWGNKISPMLQNIGDAFMQAGIRTEVTDNPGKNVWTKLTLICIAGTLNAVTRLRVGDLMGQEEGQELARLIMAENYMVAKKKGIELDPQELAAFIDAATTAAAEHITSMLKDVLSQRKTEIGSFNEAVAIEAERLGLAAPVNKTVGLLMRIIENTYERQLFEA
jgi:2-dehydropantoate 2-reductase